MTVFDEGAALTAARLFPLIVRVFICGKMVLLLLLLLATILVAAFPLGSTSIPLAIARVTRRSGN